MKKGLVQPRSPKGSPPEGMAQPEDGDRNEWQREAGEGRKRKKGAGPSGIRGARWASGDLPEGMGGVGCAEGWVDPRIGPRRRWLDLTGGGVGEPGGAVWAAVLHFRGTQCKPRTCLNLLV